MKQKKPDWESVELSHIRIEVTELLEILKRVSGDKYEITSETSSTIFESVEEMKSHLAESARAETITIGPVEFETGRKWRDTPKLSICLYEWRWEDVDYTIEDARLLMNALEKELISYKRWLASPLAMALFRIPIFAGPILALSALRGYLFGFDWTQPSTAIGGWIFFIPGAVTIFATGEYLLKKAIGEYTVFYQPRETWWQRHSGEVFVGAVIAAIGVVANYL